MATPKKKPEEKLKPGKKFWKPTPAELEQIKSLSTTGATDTQIAVLLGISEATLYKYKNIYPDLADAVKYAKRKSNALVENALFKSAMKGNPASIIYWLKNRSQKRWNERNIVRHENADGKNIETPIQNNVILVPAEKLNSADWAEGAKIEHAKIKSATKRNLETE